MSSKIPGKGSLETNVPFEGFHVPDMAGRYTFRSVFHVLLLE